MYSKLEEWKSKVFKSGKPPQNSSKRQPLQTVNTNQPHHKPYNQSCNPITTLSPFELASSSPFNPSSILTASTPLNPDHQVTQYDVFKSNPRTKDTLTITPIPVEENKLRRSSSLPDFTEQSREENPSLNNSGYEQWTPYHSPQPDATDVPNRPYVKQTSILKVAGTRTRKNSTVAFDKVEYQDGKRLSYLSLKSHARPTPSTKSTMSFRGGYVYGGFGHTPGSMGAVPEVQSADIEYSTLSVGIVSHYSTALRGMWNLCPVTVVKTKLDSETDPVLDMFAESQFEDSVIAMFKEIDLLSHLRHPNIPLLLAVCSGPAPRDVTMVLEALPLGSLYKILHVKKDLLSIEQVTAIVQDIALALHYLHTNNYLHTGVSSTSIMIGRTAKLGHLAHVQDSQYPAQTLGCWRWTEPRLWKQGELPKVKSDVYGWGCVLWECLQGQIPWHWLTEPTKATQLILKGKEKLPKPKRGGTLADITVDSVSGKVATFKMILNSLRKVNKTK